MDRNLEVKAQWIMDHFRRRWAYERSAVCLSEFVQVVDGLTSDEAYAIVTGHKKFVSKARGYVIEDDNAETVDNLPLRWDL